MSTPATDVRFTDRAATALGSIRRLVVPTDLPGIECLDVAREVVRRAAKAEDFEVVLYDRSAETWMDHPHPSGPHRADDLSDDFAALAEQLRGLEAEGINASGWISTVPSLTEIAQAVEQTGADAVLLPEPSCDRTLVDRLTGTGDQNEDVAKSIDTNATRRVVVLEIDDGEVDLVTETG
jgi:hypothetical protein